MVKEKQSVGENVVIVVKKAEEEEVEDE